MTDTADPPAAGAGPLRMATLVAGALAGVACILAVWFGISWFRAAHDESIALAMARDAALRDAQQVAVNVNTLDYRQARGGFELWEQSATGTALEEFQQNRDAYLRTVTEAKMISTARALDGAVAELDNQAGTARVLVGVDVTRAPEQQQASCVRQRLMLEMKRTLHGWKVDQLAPVGPLEPVPGSCPAAGFAQTPPN
jgi:Mce-associated membrane protein